MLDNRVMDVALSFVGGLVGGGLAFSLLGGAQMNSEKTIQRFQVNKDARFCHGIKYGGLFYTSGQMGEFDKLKDTDVVTQTEQALKKIDILLAEAGTHKANILEARVWLKDVRRDKESMNAVWNRWIDPNNKPTRFCVQSDLANPDGLVEIQVVAKT